MKHVDMRSLTAEAQEERRRQVIGLRQAGQTYAAIAAQVGLTQTGVFDICKRFAEHGPAGLKSKPRGPALGHGNLLTAEQEAEVQALMRQQMPDEDRKSTRLNSSHANISYAVFCLKKKKQWCGNSR